MWHRYIVTSKKRDAKNLPLEANCWHVLLSLKLFLNFTLLMIPLVFYYFAQLTNWDMKKIFICWSPVSLSETELDAVFAMLSEEGFDAMDEVFTKRKMKTHVQRKRLKFSSRIWNITSIFSTVNNWMSRSDVIVLTYH